MVSSFILWAQRNKRTKGPRSVAELVTCLLAVTNMLDKSILGKEGCDLGSQFEHKKVIKARAGDSWSHCVCSQEAERRIEPCSAGFLLFIPSRTPGHSATHR